jgi:hypothetical protein
VQSVAPSDARGVAAYNSALRAALVRSALTFVVDRYATPTDPLRLGGTLRNGPRERFHPSRCRTEFITVSLLLSQ